ncbi:hypothetical protein MPH_13638 [Macrophomina phaseolina MS6]|uniref:Pleckstrin homology domain-containing protein n=1 Tax=Macrophomina phaseolina (strain MS6) TaxID=1126212 RepID=K2RGU3_MACPH|nr:hypothetical protein MPH_13638 [Macrophomina phaseolina MS6]
MATEYFSDQESSMATNSLPTPSDTPFMTPQPSTSRRSSRHGTPSSMGDLSQASPAPPPSDFTSDDPANDENISILDPRRFTPTLHANLVAEILNLRRELDSKHRVIEDLETNLHSTKEENEVLNDKLSTSLRESRSAKRQIQQLETGTLSALEELAKERDRFKADNEQLKSKLELTQKKARSEVDASDRTQDLWQKDKEAWDNDKRSLERRLHITETRLKVVLEELAAQQEAVEAQAEGVAIGSRDGANGHESDSASTQSSPKKGRHRRNQSSGSARSVRSFGPRGYRASVLTIGSEAQAKLSHGLSLADELAFDEEDEDLEDLELDSDDYTEHEIRARRIMEARASSIPDEKARKMLGLMIEERTTPTPSEPDRDRSASLDTTLRDDSPDFLNQPRRQESLDTIVATPADQKAELKREAAVEQKRVEYVDTGVQPSPPPSPRVTAQQITAARSSGHIMAAMDVEANQRKKRVSAPPSESQREKEVTTSQRKAGLMVSTSCQTLGQPLSPPETPTVILPPPPVEPAAPEPKPQMNSASTQTEARVDHRSEPLPEVRIEPPQSPPRASVPAPIPIPQITIHPPGSTPASPKHAVLPPNTKSAACQTGSDLTGNMRDTSMQTEPIRIDPRTAKLPPHLLPSAISSKPGTPTQDEKKVQPVLAKPFEEKGKPPLLPSTHELLKSMRPISVQATQDKYPGNNDDGPLTRESTDGIRRPFRTSSLFAGFDGASSDEDAAADEERSSDEEDYRGQQAVVIRAVKYGRMFGKPPTPVPEEKEPNSKRSSYEKRSSVEKRHSAEKRSSYEKPAKVEKPVRAGSLRKQPSVRRSALMQSGITAHDRRPPSPAFGEASSSKTLMKPKPPPFPVPTRSSSRKVPLSKSEGSQSPTPRSGNMFTSRRSRQQQQHARQDSLRKVRSAAVIRRDGRQRSKSPPLPQSSFTSPEDIKDVPPLPRDRVTSPYQAYSSRHHGRQPSVSTAVTNSNQSASSVQSVSVVDAIAATMVGEWLWKYVRGRRSFGVADAVTPEFGKDDGTGGSSIRHKRWVWISPYERAIMWSSKQPTSGTALLGKTGRKLQIQSVLDVKDDTPAPRGVGVQPIFNRSILILTPARALKFTAPSADRHYLWLTALSFLAHSSQAVPDLNQLPSAPAEESPQTKRPTAALGRRPITNSVRLAKQNQSGAKGYTNRAEPIYEGEPSQSPISEAASPPVIPRFHGRKRSMTSPRQAAIPPPIPGNPFTRSFSHNHAVHSSSAVPPPIPTSSYSSAASSVGMSEMHSPGGANIPPSVPSSIYNPSRRTSEASSSAATASGTRREFFDAASGTVRMEAFVEPRLSQDSRFPGGGFPGLAPSFKEKSAARQYRKNSQWSVKSGTTGSEVPSRAPSQASGKYSGEQGSDLFRGF